MTDSEVLLRQFGDYPHDTERQDEAAARLIETDTAMLAAAECTYFDHCSASNRRVDRNFRPKFVRAWSAFTRNALSHIGPARPDVIAVELQAAAPTLYVLWHFPEYPLLMGNLLGQNVTVAVAQDSEWLRPLARVGLAANFNRTGGLMALRRACEKRQPVAMMLDYCYEGTRHRVADFLGLPCKTPSGLIEVSLRLGYAICLVSSSDLSIRVEQVPPHQDVNDCIHWLNARISEHIERDPTRWLLWPSLNSRVAI